MRFLILTVSASIYAALVPFGDFDFAKTWSYDIHYKAAKKVIEVSAEFSNVEALTIDSSSSPFVRELKQKVGKGFEPLPREGDVWTASSCRESCVIRYSFAIDEALKKRSFPGLSEWRGIDSYHEAECLAPSTWGAFGQTGRQAAIFRRG